MTIATPHLKTIIAINRQRLGLDSKAAVSDAQFSAETGAVQRLCVYGRMRPGGPDAHRLADLGGTWQEGAFAGYLQSGGVCSLDQCPGLAWSPTAPWNTGFILTSDALQEFWSHLDDSEGTDYARLLTQIRANGTEFIATASDGSGARDTETLYLELRQGAEPVNPIDWFTATAPTGD